VVEKRGGMLGYTHRIRRPGVNGFRVQLGKAAALITVGGETGKRLIISFTGC